MADNNNFNSFDDMEFLSYELMKGIFDYGFKNPSRIQNLTIKFNALTENEIQGFLLKDRSSDLAFSSLNGINVATINKTFDWGNDEKLTNALKQTLSKDGAFKVWSEEVKNNKV